MGISEKEEQRWETQNALQRSERYSQYTYIYDLDYPSKRTEKHSSLLSQNTLTGTDILCVVSPLDYQMIVFGLSPLDYQMIVFGLSPLDYQMIVFGRITISLRQYFA